METYRSSSGIGKIIILAVYVIFGLYFINTKFLFLKIPEAITALNEWILVVGGVLILLGGFNYLRSSK